MVADGGDQADQLPLPITGPVGYLILHHPHHHRLPGIQILPGVGRSASRALPRISGLTSTDRYDPSGKMSRTGNLRSDFTRHSSCAPVPAAYRQSP
jgi:hypothetical protein